MSFFQPEKLQSIITEIASETTRKNDTLEIQVCLKGYDLKKDLRFDGTVVLPFPKRKVEKIMIVGDKQMEEQATTANLPFISFDDVTGKTKERKTLKKKLASKNHAIITNNMFHKHFEIMYLNRKRTPFFLTRANVDLKTLYEEVLHSLKFKLRQTNVISFPVGYFELKPEDIAQNANVALNFFVTLLKKGAQNIDSVFLKSTQGKAVKLY